MRNFPEPSMIRAPGAGGFSLPPAETIVPSSTTTWDTARTPWIASITVTSRITTARRSSAPAEAATPAPISTQKIQPNLGSIVPMWVIGSR